MRHRSRLGPVDRGAWRAEWERLLGGARAAAPVAAVTRVRALRVRTGARLLERASRMNWGAVIFPERLSGAGSGGWTGPDGPGGPWRRDD